MSEKEIEYNHKSLTSFYSIQDVTSEALQICYKIVNDCIHYGNYKFTQVLVKGGQEYGKDKLKRLLPALKSAYIGFAVVTDNNNFEEMDNIESVRDFSAVDLENFEIPPNVILTFAPEHRPKSIFPPNWTKEDSERLNRSVMKGYELSRYLEKLEEGEDVEDPSISLNGLYWMILEMYDWVMKNKGDDLKKILADTKFKSPEDALIILKSLTTKKALYYIGHKWRPEVTKLKELYHRWDNNPDKDIQREVLRVMEAIKKVFQESF